MPLFRSSSHRRILGCRRWMLPMRNGYGRALHIGPRGGEILVWVEQTLSRRVSAIAAAFGRP